MLLNQQRNVMLAGAEIDVIRYLDVNVLITFNRIGAQASMSIMLLITVCALCVQECKCVCVCVLLEPIRNVEKAKARIKTST